MNMVERVARAIYAEFENRPLYAQEQMNDALATELARAAIAAMREPTDRMIKTGSANIAPWYSPGMRGGEDYGNTTKAASAAFSGMIDAALKEDDNG